VIGARIEIAYRIRRYAGKMDASFSFCEIEVPLHTLVNSTTLAAFQREGSDVNVTLSKADA